MFVNLKLESSNLKCPSDTTSFNTNAVALLPYKVSIPLCPPIAIGLSVPIPTLPELSIVNLSSTPSEILKTPRYVAKFHSLLLSLTDKEAPLTPLFWTCNTLPHPWGLSIVPLPTKTFPAKKLHILNDTDTAQIRLGQTGSGSYDIGVRTGDKFSIGRDNDTQEFTISGGNVGIGTDSPNYKLAVEGSIAVQGADNLWLRGGRIGFENVALNNAAYIYNIGAAGSSKLNIADSLYVIEAGNVGIGTDSPDVKLEVSGGADSIARITGTTTSARLDLKTNSYHKFFQTIESDGRFRLYNQTTGSEELTVLNSGNVGIGSGNPQNKLDIEQSAAVSARLLATGATSSSLKLEVKGGATQLTTTEILANSSGALTFATGTTAASEKMRITSGGRVYINSNAYSRDAFTMIQGDSTSYALGLDAPVLYAGAYRYQSFFSGSNIAGTISGNTTTSVSYNTSSDYRMKKNIKPLENGLKRLCELKPVKFDWKENDSSTEGFIAHEVQEIFPDAISGEKDGELMQGMDYGRITPLLVKAIQELTAKVERLEAK